MDKQGYSVKTLTGTDVLDSTPFRVTVKSLVIQNGMKSAKARDGKPKVLNWVDRADLAQMCVGDV